MLICFNGIDGSGKSFQAQRLVDRLNAAGYPAVYVWGGGQATFTMPFIRAGKWLLKGPRKHQLDKSAGSAVRAQYRDYVATTRRILQRRSIRNGWLQFCLIDHTLEIWRTMLPQLLRKRIVVCDRYIYDSIIRIAVMSGVKAAELSPLLHLPPIYCVPRPSKWFFLDVPAEVAFSRKHDILDIEFLERRIPLYRVAAARLGMQIVDGAAAPDDIAAIIWQSMQPLLPHTARTALRHG
jgi:dTMP kinase